MAGPTRTEVGAIPAPALRRFVTRYAGFELAGLPPGEHLGTPAHTLTAVITFGGPLEVRVPPPLQGTGGEYASIASGLTTRAVAIRHGGDQRGVKLSLTPVGARALYGLPAAQLADAVVPLDGVLGGLGRELQERLRAATTWPDRFHLLDELLARAVARTERTRTGALDVRPEVAASWRRLVETWGQVRVDTLARELGWSRRHLSARFRAEFGLAPKTLARILRFEHAHRLATGAATPSWAEVAAQAGYADQAHLVRDWRDFTGHTPAAWLGADLLADGLGHG